MSLERDTVYSVIADPAINLGYILNDNFYGTHYSERGPIDIKSMNDFVVDGLTMRRLKDNVEFRLVKVEDIQ